MRAWRAWCSRVCPVLEFLRTCPGEALAFLLPLSYFGAFLYGESICITYSFFAELLLAYVSANSRAALSRCPGRAGGQGTEPRCARTSRPWHCPAECPSSACRSPQPRVRPPLCRLRTRRVLVRKAFGRLPLQLLSLKEQRAGVV